MSRIRTSSLVVGAVGLSMATAASSVAAVVAVPASALGTSIGDTPAGDKFTARQQVTTPGNPAMQPWEAGYPGPVPAGYAGHTALNAVGGLQVLKDWSAVPLDGNFDGNSENVLTFADPALPAIRLTITGLSGWNQGGGATGGFDSQTSDTRLTLQGNDGTVKIEFGSFDGVTFTPGTVAAAGVDAGNSDGGNGLRTVFKSGTGATLSDQFGGNPGDWKRAGDTSYFFGSDAGGIASIELAYSNNNSKITGLDNLAFVAAVPEPTGLAFASTIGAAALRRRRRRRA